MQVVVHTVGGLLHRDRYVSLDRNRIAVHESGQLQYQAVLPERTVRKVRDLALAVGELGSLEQADLSDYADAAASELTIAEGSETRSILVVDGADVPDEVFDLLELLDDASQPGHRESA